MAPKDSDLISFPIHLSREVDRLFEELIHQPWGFCREIRGWNPAVDLYETTDTFVVEADLPGVTPEDIKVEVRNGDLVLQGGRSLERHETDGRFHAMERGSGYFVRQMKLPRPVNKEAIKAEFKDGVLRIVLPKIAHEHEY